MATPLPSDPSRSASLLRISRSTSSSRRTGCSFWGIPPHHRQEPVLRTRRRAAPLRRRAVGPRAVFAHQWDIDGSFSRRALSVPYPTAVGPAARAITEPGACILQGFSWNTLSGNGNGNGRTTWYQLLAEQVPDIAACGFSQVILPPCCQSSDAQGFSPQDFYSTDSAYGSTEELQALTSRLRDAGVGVGLEVVIARGFGQEEVQWRRHTNTADQMVWPPGAFPEEVVVGAGPSASPVMDHSNPFVEADCKGWLLWLKQEFGFTSWRFDLAAKLNPAVVHSYCEDTDPAFAIADVWRAMRYNGPALEYDQAQHREDLASWVRAAKGRVMAMDYTTKGILQQAVERCEFWRLADSQGEPPGLLGLMPSSAVTFVENHFTGAQLRWWPFPSWGVMVGYAYILTHPGLPCIFHDHMFQWNLKEPIRELLDARRRNGIARDSEVKILLCKNDIYVARVGKNVNDGAAFRGVVLKIGPSMDMQGTCPDSSWAVAASGANYCVWEQKS